MGQNHELPQTVGENNTLSQGDNSSNYHYYLSQTIGF